MIIKGQSKRKHFIENMLEIENKNEKKKQLSK